MENNLPENRQIYLTLIGTAELERKIKLKDLGLALHRGIQLTSYGSSLRRFYCTFLIAAPEEEHLYPAFVDYEAEDLEADVAVKIPYQQASQADAHTLARMLEKAFLESIDALAGLDIPDFDAAALRRDVESVLGKGGSVV